MSFFICALKITFITLNVNFNVMTEKIKVPQREKKTHNFTIRFSDSERRKLDEFCTRKNTTLTALVRFSLQTIMERAK